MRKIPEIGWLIIATFFGFLLLYYFSGFIDDFQGSDASIYGIIARNAAEGNSLRSDFVWAGWDAFSQSGAIPQFYRYKDPPLYILAVALFFKVFGSSFWVMKFANVTFGALLVIPSFYLTKKLFGVERAIVACLLSFTYPLLVISAIVPGDKIFSALIITSALCLVTQGIKVRYAFLAGIFSGLTLMTRIDFGIMVFISAYVFYCFGGNLKRGTWKQHVLASNLFTLGFVSSVLPWAFSNHMTFGFFLRITGIMATMVGARVFLDVSLRLFLLAVGLVSVVGTMSSFLASRLIGLKKLFPRTFLTRRRILMSLLLAAIPIFVAFFLIKGLGVYMVATLCGYPQLIYKSSPVIFVFALVGFARNINKVELTHPVFTLPLIAILSYTALTLRAGGSLGETYTVPYISLLIVFASTGIFEVASTFSAFYSASFLKPKMRLFRLWIIRISRNLILIFVIAIILLSFLTQYTIITNSEKLQKGPFLVEHQGEASDWLLLNTNKNDTILARYPVIAFYTGRRTVVLDPLNVTELLTYIKAAHASYMVIDSTAYREAQSVPVSMIAWLYDYPESFPGFKLMYQVENPRLQIFDVSSMPDQTTLVGWSDDNFTNGWNVDPGLHFESDSDIAEISYNNTNGTAAKFLGIRKTLSPPLSLQQYPFLIVRYRFKSWTLSGSPIHYFRIFVTDVNGKEYSSDEAPYPTHSSDYEWHTLVWAPSPLNITSIRLLIRIGPRTEFSVVIDCVETSKWPIYVKPEVV